MGSANYKATTENVTVSGPGAFRSQRPPRSGFVQYSRGVRHEHACASL